MRRAGIDLRTGAQVLSLEKAQEGVRVKASNGEQRVFDQGLFASPEHRGRRGRRRGCEAWTRRRSVGG
jgi:glutathione reductase (NADPH)